MKINSFTNYAFRILIMLGANPDKTISLTEVAHAYDISLNHLKKVSARLVEHKLVSTERGRSGGLKLLRNPEDIRLGEIFQLSQTDTAFVECMGDSNAKGCAISPVCKLQSIFTEALDCFIQFMDGFTLEDLVQNKEELNQHLGIEVVQV
jgi:Rrf2 family nitric oxide-sensitive transcriptional repressor